MERPLRYSWFSLALGALVAVSTSAPASAQPFVYTGTFGRYPLMTSMCIFSPLPCEGPSVKTINRATFRQLSRIELVGFQSERFVRAMALAPDGRTLVVSGANGTTNAVWAIDTTSSVIARQVALPAAPGGVTVSADGARIFVAIPAENAVRVLDFATLSTTTSIPVGASPTDVVLSPNGSALFVSNSGSDTVSRVSTTSNSVVATVTVGNQPGAITVNGNGSRAYVINAGSRTVSIIDATTNLVVGSAPAGDSTKPPPRDVAVTSSGDRIFVSLATGSSSFVPGRTGELSIIDGTSNTIVGSIAIQGPWGLDMDASGTLYVAAGDGVKVVDVATSTVTATLPASYDPLEVVVSKVTTCQYESSASADALAAGGGAFTLAIPAPASCGWSVVGLPSWMQAGATSGTGPATMTLTIPATGTPRSATFNVGPQLFTFTQTVPAMAVDVAPGQTIAPPGSIGGWAIEQDGGPSELFSRGGTGVDAVHVWAYPATGGAPIFVGAANLGGSRSDVGAIFGGRYTASAFWVSLRGLTPGAYTLVCFAHGSLTHTFDLAAAVPVKVAASKPLMVVDLPQQNAVVTQPFLITGWAIDPAAPAAAGSGVDVVHVWAQPTGGGAPTFLGSAPVGRARGDVGSAFAPSFLNSAFDLRGSGLTPGSYQLVAYAHSTVTGTFNNAFSVPIIVAGPSQPLFIERVVVAPRGSFTAPITVSGWAIDERAATGSGVLAVHIWAHPVGEGLPQFLGAWTPFFDRPDVAGAFGPRFLQSGWQVSTTGFLPPGTWDVVVYALSAASGTFDNTRVVRIVVQ